MLRIPEWAAGASISVNNKHIEETLIPSSYHKIQRTWSHGDRVAIDFPMHEKLIEAHPLVEDLRNQVAVKRGPIVYCLESTDLPENIKISEIVIPQNCQFTSDYNKELLGGVNVLQGTVKVVEEGDWSNRLYRDLRKTNIQRKTISLIPYYAWENRGESEMSVWLPIR
jgi:uncharacterized protein